MTIYTFLLFSLILMLLAMFVSRMFPWWWFPRKADAEPEKPAAEPGVLTAGRKLAERVARCNGRVQLNKDRERIVSSYAKAFDELLAEAPNPCPRCGGRGVRFCRRCGKRLVDDFYDPGPGASIDAAHLVDRLRN